MIPQESLGLLFCRPILDEFRGKEQYRLCRNHYNYDSSNRDEENTYPADRIDLRSIIFQNELPENSGLEELAWQRFMEEWDEIGQRDALNACGVEPFFDLNSYRIMPDVPLANLDWQWQDLADEMTNEEGDADYLEQELEELDESLREVAKQLMLYKEWLSEWREEIKQYYSEFIVIVDSEGRYDYVHRQEFEDYKDELYEDFVEWKGEE